MVSFSENIWIAIKLKTLTYQKAQGNSYSDVLQFTCCCPCNGTFQQVTVKDYGNWRSAKGRCFMPFSNCAPLFHVIFVLVFCLFIFLLMYYSVACQITGTKIYTNKSSKNAKSFHLFSKSTLEGDFATWYILCPQLERSFSLDEVVYSHYHFITNFPLSFTTFFF